MIEIVLSVVLAELSYRFIETPIRHGIIGEYFKEADRNPGRRRSARYRWQEEV